MAQRMSSSFSHISKFLGRLAGRRAPQQDRDPDADPDPDLTPEPTEQESSVPSGDTPDASPSPPPPAAEALSSEPGIATGHQLLRRIGNGAYGEVWLGQDELGNFHAVKLVRRANFSDKAPFEREYRGLLQYTPISRTHHGLVHILNVGRDNVAGVFFYVMELADCLHGGRVIQPEGYTPHTLEQSLSSRGPLSLTDTLSLGIELCEALGYLHSKQLIHRDIKPPNIVYVNGVAKLADVGLITHMAEARRDPKHLGTEGFIPPEGPGTPLADVYSLGKVMAEAAFGTTTLPAPETCTTPAMARFSEIMSHACHDNAESRSASPAALQAELMELQEVVQRDAAVN
jgi:serine/threonine protein kinase